jgi:hypothetical protein
MIRPQPASCGLFQNLLGETFHVDDARAAHRAVNQAANRSGSMSGAAPTPNSVTIQSRTRP